MRKLHTPKHSASAGKQLTMPANGPPTFSLVVESTAEAIWTLKEIAKKDTKQVRKDVLSPIQDEGMYYAATTIKKLGGTISTVMKEKRMAEVYKDVGAPGIMEWVQEEAEVALPIWLTKSLMGHSTLTGSGDYARYLRFSVFTEARARQQYCCYSCCELQQYCCRARTTVVLFLY